MLKESCRSWESLEKNLVLREDEAAWFEKGTGGLSLMVNPYFLNLAGCSEGLRRQCIPRERELSRTPGETDDPLSEAPHSPVPRMVHRYSNRVAILVTDQCALHCRHCFRRSFTGKGNLPLTPEETSGMTAYLAEHPEVQEILFTGGDPLTLDDRRLLEILQTFRNLRPDLVFRLATRTPSVLPQRITEELCRGLTQLGPLWVITQFNHPDELTGESRLALKTLRRAGLPVMNQTVLLKGINDSSSLLADLFQSLLTLGVKPYYLFQGDLAAGTSHFRTTLDRGWEIVRELRQKISGLAMPVYAVDLPGGGGKIPLQESLLIERNADAYVFRNVDGDIYTYPREGMD